MPRKGSAIRKTDSKSMSWKFRKLPFWERVEAQTAEQDGCHIFKGCKDDCGYGRIFNGTKLVRLHRAMWEKHNGLIPQKMVVMHVCDTPACINPAHLQIGTQTENIADMDRKGRRRFKWSFEQDYVF